MNDGNQFPKFVPRLFKNVIAGCRGGGCSEWELVDRGEIDRVLPSVKHQCAGQVARKVRSKGWEWTYMARVEIDKVGVTRTPSTATRRFGPPSSLTLPTRCPGALTS